MKKLNSLTYMVAILPFIALIIFFAACTKEGPAGPAGKDGTNGTNGIDGKDGKDGGTTCTTCHNQAVVEGIAAQYELSKHSYGEAAFEEAGNTGCGPCHEAEAFKYVVANNTPATFTLNTTTMKYANNYASIPSAAYGEINCFTCHIKLHTNYDSTDLPGLTTVAPVALNMRAGLVSVDLPADGGTSNLCVKCHQPRPMTTSTSLWNGALVPYDSFALTPTLVWFDSAVGNKRPNKQVPSYRMHLHYGTVGAAYAGKGAIEFTGPETYMNSVHTTVASCQDCHMASITGRAGGHTFFAKGNFNGCNTSDCHSANPINSSNSAYWTTPRKTIQDLLVAIAAKLTSNGVEFMHRNTDAEANPFASVTTQGYDGYLDIYDPSTNPDGVHRNPAPSGSWTTAQKATNTALPKFTSLTYAQMGAIINFQYVLREYSLGIHNYKYVKALLTNTLAAL
jgi:hypothetical protein